MKSPSLGGERMKIEKISPNEIVLIYTKEDLDDLGIKMDKYFDDSQKICRDLIEEAEIDESFFDDDSKTVIEAMATVDGGLRIKLKRIPLTFKSKKDKIKHKKNLDLFPLIYEFSDFEKVIHSVKQIKYDFSGVGSLFKMENNYFLLLNAINENVALLTDIKLCEYGNKILNSKIYEGKLKEYGDVLIKDTAVFDLSENFS